MTPDQIIAALRAAIPLGSKFDPERDMTSKIGSLKLKEAADLIERLVAENEDCHALLEHYGRAGFEQAFDLVAKHKGDRDDQ